LSFEMQRKITINNCLDQAFAHIFYENRSFTAPHARNRQ